MAGASSSVVTRVLHDAHASNTRFRVIVADSRPRLEGALMMEHSRAQENAADKV